MRTQRRNQKLIYLCQKYQDKKVTKYKKPIPIYEHYAATTTDTDLLSMGVDYYRRLRIRTDNKIFLDGKWQNRNEVYHVGDKVYVYNKPPVNYDELCNDADFEVEVIPNPTPNQLEIILVSTSGNFENKAQF